MRQYYIYLQLKHTIIQIRRPACRGKKPTPHYLTRIYIASIAHINDIWSFKRVPITEALWKIDNGPNCFQFIMDLRERTRRINAQELMNTNTTANKPSKDETFVIQSEVDWIYPHLSLNHDRYLPTPASSFWKSKVGGASWESNHVRENVAYWSQIWTKIITFCPTQHNGFCERASLFQRYHKVCSGSSLKHILVSAV